MDEGAGFAPALMESESTVLLLNDPSMWMSRKDLNLQITYFQRVEPLPFGHATIKTSRRG